jgi:PAS domain S-box-containing protein
MNHSSDNNIDVSAELSNLRQRIAELEQTNSDLRTEIADLQQQAAASASQAAVSPPQTEPAGSVDKENPDTKPPAREHPDDLWNYFRSVIEHTPDGIIITDSTGREIYTNPAFGTMTRFGTQLVKRFICDTIERGREQKRQSDVKWQSMLNFRRHDGTTFTGLLSAFLIPDAVDTVHAAAAIVRDVTEQVQAEKEQAALEVALQEQLIQAQQATIRELSTPIIPLADDVVVMPLVGTIDSLRAQQIFETLLDGIEQQHARIAILDTTGIRVVDIQVATALIRTAQAARLLGSKVLITGVSPPLAHALVELGIDLSEITTYNTLQMGVVAALREHQRNGMR